MWVSVHCCALCVRFYCNMSYCVVYVMFLMNKLEIRSMERGVCPLAPLALCLTLYSLTVAEILSLKHFGVTTLTHSGHVTSSVTWPLEPQLVVSYWSSVDTMSLSRTVAEILSVKNNWVTSLTPRCHVTSLDTWPLEPHMVLSYWWSVDTKSLSRMVDEILRVIIWITIFPL